MTIIVYVWFAWLYDTVFVALQNNRKVWIPATSTAPTIPSTTADVCRGSRGITPHKSLRHITH